MRSLQQWLCQKLLHVHEETRCAQGGTAVSGGLCVQSWVGPSEIRAGSPALPCIVQVSPQVVMPSWWRVAPLPPHQNHQDPAAQISLTPTWLLRGVLPPEAHVVGVHCPSVRSVEPYVQITPIPRGIQGSNLTLRLEPRLRPLNPWAEASEMSDWQEPTSPPFSAFKYHSNKR